MSVPNGHPSILPSNQASHPSTVSLASDEEISFKFDFMNPRRRVYSQSKLDRDCLYPEVRQLSCRILKSCPVLIPYPIHKTTVGHPLVNFSIMYSHYKHSRVESGIAKPLILCILITMGWCGWWHNKTTSRRSDPLYHPSFVIEGVLLKWNIFILITISTNLRVTLVST